MAHGGYGKRQVPQRKPVTDRRRPKGLGVEKKSKFKSEPKPKSVSLKNQIRSVERLLKKDLPPDMRDAQEKKLEVFKKKQEIHNQLAVQRKIFLRGRKIKFFERRKIERSIRRLEKLQRASSGQVQEADITEQLSKLKEDLEYVRFFPKTEKYVSLFMGGDTADVVDKRNKLRKQIKANIITAKASGKDLEETGSEDDGLLDLSEDDFFLAGSSSDEPDADDEWTDKSTREQASSASGKATSGMSSDERNQRQESARALMPPPRPSGNAPSSSRNVRSGNAPSSSRNVRSGNAPSSSRNVRSKSGGPSTIQRVEMPTFRSGGPSTIQRFETPTSSYTSHNMSGASFRNSGSSDSWKNHSSNLSSNSDAHKPRRKRRPKKKKQQA